MLSVWVRPPPYPLGTIVPMVILVAFLAITYLISITLPVVFTPKDLSEVESEDNENDPS